MRAIFGLNAQTSYAPILSAIDEEATWPLNPMDVAVSLVNCAECDGYLFGYVEISSGLTVATTLSGLNVKLLAGPDRLLAGQEPVAGMTMIYTNQGGIHDCLGAPIRKGDYYTLTIEGGAGLQINSFFRFYPLVRH